MRRIFFKDSFYSASAREVFEFHERPDAFEILSPPDFAVDVRHKASTIRPSEEIVKFQKKVMAVPFNFEMVHTVYRPPHLFVDEQLRGPFSFWRHEHCLIEGGWEKDPATLLRDKITYAHPLLFAGNFAVSWPLSKLFEARHTITRKELSKVMKKGEQKTYILTGGTGLIGKRITEILIEKGEKVILFVRNIEKAKKIFGETVDYALWDFSKPDENSWKEKIEEAHGVIHLAGTPLFAKRWSPAFKKEMKESRTLSTHELVKAIKEAKNKPEVFLCASAVGIYGTDPKILATEKTSYGTDLLADICVAWEKEAQAVGADDVRSVQMRIGVVLDTHSGALKEMLPLFKLFGGGVLGKPDRWINWIHLEDAVRIFIMALYNQDVTGPINVVSPHPVSNKSFAQSLSYVLRRPCLMIYPEFLLKIAIGESAEYASGGPRVTSDLVESQGYRFFFNDVESALRNLLKRL